MDSARYAEALGHGEERVFHVEEMVYRGHTEFQYVEIVRAKGYGLTLFLNGQRQSSAADEFIYHEMLVHPALLRLRSPRRVLIAGGGEGAVAREILRSSTVEQVVQVDIDGALIDLCRRYLPGWNSGAYEDPRHSLLIADALGYLREIEQRFDLIVLDLPEWSPETPARALYTTDFYRLVGERLAAGGLLALQVGPIHPVHSDAFLVVARRLREAFAHCLFYMVPELRWGFAVCAHTAPTSDWCNPAIAPALRYYNTGLHSALGALPSYIQKDL